MRRRSAHRFAAGAADVARQGAEVLLPEPSDRDLHETSGDVMDARRAVRVAPPALVTTTEELGRPSLRPLLRELARARA
jgi:hypothetical protein